MSEDYRIVELSDNECWEILDRERFGRLAVAVHGDPDIFPVNFLVDDGKLLMRTEGDTAWSVVLKGVARMVESFSETYADDAKHLETWLPSDKPIFVEITPRSLSGRRFLRGSAV